MLTARGEGELFSEMGTLQPLVSICNLVRSTQRPPVLVPLADCVPPLGSSSVGSKVSLSWGVMRDLALLTDSFPPPAAGIHFHSGGHGEETMLADYSGQLWSLSPSRSFRMQKRDITGH